MFQRTSDAAVRAHVCESEPLSVIVRLEKLPATPESLARLRRRVEEMNREFEQSGVSFRLRVL